MKLDIGSGTMPLGDGWTTVDLYEPADFQWDMRRLTCADGEIEAINCSHALEHLTRGDGAEALAEFHRVLMPGGNLSIEVPDFDEACRQWLEGIDDDRTLAYQAIFGEQSGPGMLHLSGYNEMDLALAITTAGFEEPTIEEIRSHGVMCLLATAVRG